MSDYLLEEIVNMAQASHIYAQKDKRPLFTAMM